jgi:NADH-quinone oxidoreductase subunit L
MTAFYMFRLIYLTFYSKPRMSPDVEHHIHESPASMTMPLVVLAVMSLFAGFLGWPHSLGGSDRFARFLDPVFARGEARVFVEEGKARQLAAGEKEEEHTSPTEILLMLLSVAAAGTGWFMAGRSYRNADKGYVEPIAAASAPVYNTLLNKYYVDEGYDYVFTGRRKAGDVRLGVLGLGEASSWFDSHIVDGAVNAAGAITRGTATFSSWWDKRIIDGLFVNGIAYATQPFSYLARLFEWGLVQWYALVMTAGLVGFAFYYVYH